MSILRKVKQLQVQATHTGAAADTGGTITPKSPVLEVHPGDEVEFTSPLFGLCRARVVATTDDDLLVVDHEVVGPDPVVTIRRRWVVRVVAPEAR